LEINLLIVCAGHSNLAYTFALKTLYINVLEIYLFNAKYTNILLRSEISLYLSSLAYFMPVRSIDLLTYL